LDGWLPGILLGSMGSLLYVWEDIYSVANINASWRAHVGGSGAAIAYGGIFASCGSGDNPKKPFLPIHLPPVEEEMTMAIP